MKNNDSKRNLVKEFVSKTPKIERKSHSYKQEKGPPIPSGIDNLTIQEVKKSKRTLTKAKVILQKAPKSALEQMHCTQNQNYPLFFIEKAESLRMRNVQNVKFKEGLIAARNLKKLPHRMQQWMHQRVKVLGESPEEFYTLLERREERHFQIDRIIRYLSDM